mgnify:CR=1 FL=1
MKRTGLICALVMLVSVSFGQKFEYKVVTIVESIVPMGIGRSRLIEHTQQMDVNAFTTVRTEGKDSKQEDVDRSDAKIDAFKETKLLNFYSGAGINFQNIASNDALITSKINTMINDGWDLAYAFSGVESVGGQGDNNGIYITRLIFKKPK